MKCHVRTFPTIHKSSVEVFANGINTVNRQKLPLILYHSLLNNVITWFKAQRYGIPKWARLYHM